MSITTTALLPAPVQTNFSLKLLSVPVPYMVMGIAAEKKAMPRNGGTTMRMRRYNPLAPAPVPLGNSGITPAPQTLSSINIDAQMDFYGTFVLLNEQCTLQNQDPVLNEAARRLGVSLRETEDNLTRDCLSGTLSFINSVNGSNADSPTEITRQDIDGVIKALRLNSAYSFTTGMQGENRFGTAPVRDALTKYAHLKPLLIDLELLAA